jgi:hypothetical protein
MLFYLKNLLKAYPMESAITTKDLGNGASNTSISDMQISLINIMFDRWKEEQNKLNKVPKNDTIDVNPTNIRRGPNRP